MKRLDEFRDKTRPVIFLINLGLELLTEFPTLNDEK